MKKLIGLIAGVLLSLSCSFTVDQVFLIPSATASVTITESPVRTPTPSATPTVPTPTFSLTPTLVGQRTVTVTPDVTPSAPATSTPLPLYTPPTATPPVNTIGFVTVNISQHEFYKHGVCEPQSVRFTAQVAKPAETKFVVLFVRFHSKLTRATSTWTSITMDTIGAGTYIHDLTGIEMKAVDSFENAWVEYQFVATDSKLHEVGRTGIVSDGLTLLNCVPTQTPAPSATATVLKP